MPISIGRAWQLFLDDHLIDRASGISRVIHQPQKAGPVLEPQMPWESGSLHIHPDCGVFRDDAGRFHMIYKAFTWDPAVAAELPHNKSDREHHIRRKLCYATSEDGLKWSRPNLGLEDAPSTVTQQGAVPIASGSTKQNNCGVPIDFFKDLGANGNVHDPARRLLLRVAPAGAKQPDHLFTVHASAMLPVVMLT